ncbi:FkbM family methyltransferase [bacterium]|nr:FkbM family methyltransferase [bacterium]
MNHTIQGRAFRDAYRLVFTEYLRRLRRVPAVLLGKDIFFHPTTGYHGHVERFGSASCGWSIITDGINQDSVVYSFGVGEDASFDISLVNRFGLRVHAFDPTPKSIQWVRSQKFADQFALHEIGLAAIDGDVTFNPPEDPKHISHTILNRPSTSARAISVPVRRLRTIMNDLDHMHIDILKMDIEGAEYDVIDDLRATGIRPGQILVEFHHRFPDVGIAKTKAAIERLKAMGYALFSVTSNGEEFGFINKI